MIALSLFARKKIFQFKILVDRDMGCIVCVSKVEKAFELKVVVLLDLQVYFYHKCKTWMKEISKVESQKWNYN